MNKENNEINEILDEVETIETDAADELDTSTEIDKPDDKQPKKEKKRRSAGAKRRLQYRAGFTATIVIAVVAVILLNVVVGVVADRFPLTLDISKDKTFSLSEQSIQIAQQVDNDIELIIFADKAAFESPSSGINELDTTMREFFNAIKQYNNHSDGKVTYTFIDPTQEPQKFAAYSKYDVEAGDMLFLAGDRYKTATVYDGSSANDLYTLDASSYSYTGTYTFESKAEKLLASSIYTLSGGEEHIVQVLVGHEEDTYVIDGLKSLYEINGYTFEELTISGSKEFNKDASVMLIPSPAKDYSAAEIKRVQEWVYNDGNYGRQLMVFVNPTGDCPNLYEFLEVEYQITVTDELITETDLNRVQNYNYLLPMTDVDSTDFTTNSAGTAKVYTPLVRRLTTTLPAALEENTIGSYAVPLTQYPKSAELTKLESLNNTETTEDIAYAPPEDAYPLTGMIVHVIDSYNNNTQASVDGRVLVSGCAGMAYSEYIQNSSLKNEELLLDSLNAMTGMQNAITISNKTIESETVTFTNATALIVGLGIFTIALPLAVLILCLVVFMRRKNL